MLRKLEQEKEAEERELAEYEAKMKQIALQKA